MKRGITIMEVIISVSLLTTIAAIIFPTINWLITKSKQLEYENEAVLLSTQNLEVAYNVLQDNWASVTAGKIYQPGEILDADNNLKWALFEGEGVAQANFRRRIEVSEVCRDEMTGVRTACDIDDIRDERSLLLRSVVRWTERERERNIVNDLLVIRL